MAELNRGQFWHLTDNPDFALDPKHVPEDNSISIRERTRPGLYTGNPEHWINGHGYIRPYVAEIHADPAHMQAERWGGEKFLPAEHFDKAKVARVIPTDAYAREHYGEHGWIEDRIGTSFDNDQRLAPRQGNIAPFPNYRYEGPDARDMTPQQRKRHSDRLASVEDNFFQ